jgi:Tfp pilus assembly protein PilO
MKDLLAKYKIQLWLFGYLIAISAIGYFVLFPWMDKIKQESDKIQAKKVDNEIDKSRLDKIQQMEESYKELQDNAPALEVILPAGQEVAFIQILESIAKETNNKISLKISEVKKPKPAKPGAAAGTGAAAKPTATATPNPKDAKPATPAPNAAKKPPAERNIEESINYQDYLPVQITLDGDYQGLLSFIEKVENLNYYVTIISIDIEKKTIMYEKGIEAPPVEPGSTTDPFAPSQPVPQARKETMQKEVLSTIINIGVFLKQ